MWARAVSTSAGVTALAVSSSSVVSRESMSTPKVRIHCDGSATPHVCPMPRPPNAPQVLMFSRLTIALARQYAPIRSTVRGSA